MDGARGAKERSGVLALVCALLAGCGEGSAAAAPAPLPDAGGSPDAAPTADAGADSPDAPAEARSYRNAILSFLAAQSYHDFPSLSQKLSGKLEVFLLPNIRPEQILRLRVTGPNGFTHDFENVPFIENFNGYI